MHVPEGWTHTIIEEYIDLLSGYPFKSENYSNDPDDVLLLRGDNIEPGALRWRDGKRWPKHEVPDLKKYELQVGDFVIAMDRTWISSGLKVAEVKATDIPCLLVQRVSRIRAQKTFSQSLLKQVFSAHRFEQYVKGVQTETAVPHISAAQIKEFPVLVPPLPEQQKIAEILSTWDKAIEKLEALIAAKQKRKKALMQQLLTGKKRFAGFDRPWRLCYLGDVCLFKGGSAFNENYQGKINGEIPFIKVSDMNIPNNSVFINDANNWVSVEVSKKLKAKPFPKGAIVFAKVGAALLLNRRRILTRDTIIDNNMMAAIPNENSSTSFLYQLMLIIDFAKLVQDGAVPSINQSDLARLKIKIPEIKEQQKIASVLTAADTEIQTHQKQLSALKQQKKGLMQQLLTGKKRVKVAESA